jgi:hypothetical protein
MFGCVRTYGPLIEGPNRTEHRTSGNPNRTEHEPNAPNIRLQDMETLRLTGGREAGKDLNGRSTAFRSAKPRTARVPDRINVVDLAGKLKINPACFPLGSDAVARRRKELILLSIHRDQPICAEQMEAGETEALAISDADFLTSQPKRPPYPCRVEENLDRSHNSTSSTYIPAPFLKTGGDLSSKYSNDSE